LRPTTAGEHDDHRDLHHDYHHDYDYDFHHDFFTLAVLQATAG
jgi:hypothetical protein